MPEMGVAGPAKVLSIGPCPPLDPPVPGRRTQVITGTFKHTANSVLHLYVSGLPEPIGVTPNHPMYSLDRNEFIPAGALRIGERLQARDGTATWVTQVVSVPGKQSVYNLEVHRDHVYRVSSLGLLVHNTSPCSRPPYDVNRTHLFDRSRTPLPADAAEVYANSMPQQGLPPNKQIWWGRNAQGVYYRYFGNRNSMHFTGDTTDPNIAGQIPYDIIKLLDPTAP
jgi:hypothetical protein